METLKTMVWNGTVFFMAHKESVECATCVFQSVFGHQVTLSSTTSRQTSAFGWKITALRAEQAGRMMICLLSRLG
jgi:hypothetical protein